MSAPSRRIRFLVCGLARSGTTVVQRLVTELEDVHVPPETHFWRHALAMSRLAQPPFDYDASRKLLEFFNSMESSAGLGLDVERALASLPEESHLWDLFEAVVGALSPDDVPILGEKTPDHLRQAPRLMAANPQLALIGVIRDPREVFRSHLSVPWGLKDPVALAEKWVETTRILEDCSQMFPGRVVVHRLVDIVGQPREAQKEYASLIGSSGKATVIGEEAGIFDPSEWWKASALDPIVGKEPTWSSEVSPADIAVITHRAGIEMERHGFDPATEPDGPRVTPSVAAWLGIRDAGARIAGQVLPVDEDSAQLWASSDPARLYSARLQTDHAIEQREMERERTASWRARAEKLAEEQKRMRDETRRTRVEFREEERRLRGWIDDEKERSTELLAALTAERKRSTSAARQAEQALANAASWKARAEELQADAKRLRNWAEKARRQALGLHRDRVKLERDRAKLRTRLDVANWKLRSIRSRKWWRLGTALGAALKRPWRLLYFPFTAVRIAMSSGKREPRPLPTEPRQQYIRQLERATERDQSRPLAQAEQSLRDRDYEQAAEILDGVLSADPQNLAALGLRRKVHVAVGGLTPALQTSYRLGSLRDSKSNRKMIRYLTGRIRELDSRWLPEIADDGGECSPLPNRVLHLLKESLPYDEVGYTLRSHYSLLAQADVGLEPVVVTSLGFPRRIDVHEFPDVEVIDGIEYHRLDHGQLYPFAHMPFDIYMSDYATAAARLVPKIRPSVIHAGSGYRGYETALVGLALKRRYGIPLVYDVRSYLESTWTSDVRVAEQGEHYERRFATEVRCMEEADVVLTIAETMRDEIVSRGIDPDKVRVVPNAVRLDHFNPRPKSSELVTKYGLEDTVVVGYISNLGAREGIHHLVEATALLHRSGVNLKCLIVGDGPEREALSELAQDLDVANRVILAGPVPHSEVADHYALIDVFVVPRRDDRAARLVTPLKPFEAMAMKRPLLVADLPALVEVARPGERGMTFKAGDSESLAAQLRVLVEDPDLRQQYGEAGRKWVEVHRTWASNGRRYRDIYAELLGGGGE